MIGWHVGDIGKTADNRPYRILAVDLIGSVGPIAAAVLRNEAEQLTRFRADGTHPGGLTYQDLRPPTGRIEP